METSVLRMPSYKEKPHNFENNERYSQQNTPVDEATGNRRELLNLITQPTRFEILQNIYGHPQQLPSLKEIDYFMVDTSKSTIRNHLDRLIEKGMVEKVALPEEDRTRDNPQKFYGLTEECRTLLKETGLLSAERELQKTTLDTRLTPDVEKYMEAPRPDWGPASPIADDSV